MLGDEPSSGGTSPESGPWAHVWILSMERRYVRDGASFASCWWGLCLQRDHDTSDGVVIGLRECRWKNVANGEVMTAASKRSTTMGKEPDETWSLELTT